MRRYLRMLGVSCLVLSLWVGTLSQSILAEDETKIADGTYTISGRLTNATTGEESMGNSAICQMQVTVSQGQMTLCLTLQKLTSGVFSGYLGYMKYFPEYTGESLPDVSTAIDTNVLSCFSETDSFNDASSGTDSIMKGKAYPMKVTMPVQADESTYCVLVYVPIMEAISAGSGQQYAILSLDWSTLTLESEDTTTVESQAKEAQAQEDAKETESTSTSAASTSSASDASDADEEEETIKGTLTYSELTDGVYQTTAKLVKTDKSTASMGNAAISHVAKLTVKNGKCYVTLQLKGMEVNGATGYLGILKYFKSGYTVNAQGVPSGSTKAVTVDSYQTNADGSLVSDVYGTNYPKQVTFPLVSDGTSDGYFPLQVYVPVMEDIATGTGTQPVYLKLDLEHIEAVDGDVDFTFSDSDTETTTESSGSTAGASLSENTLGNDLTQQDTNVSKSSLQQTTVDTDLDLESAKEETQKVPPLRKCVLPAGVIGFDLIALFIGRYWWKKRMYQR